MPQAYKMVWKLRSVVDVCGDGANYHADGEQIITVQNLNKVHGSTSLLGPLAGGSFAGHSTDAGHPHTAKPLKNLKHAQNCLICLSELKFVLGWGVLSNYL